LADSLEDYYPAIEEKALEENTMKLASVEGVKILFIKQKNKIYVIDNRCPHQACGFSGGKLDNEFIVCPCHDWRFNLNSGEYEVKPFYKLKFYEYKIVDGQIYVKLDD
jgi:3-phenylpropionate/trans-cinnamate dioxygenase ferredoxin subunit